MTVTLSLNYPAAIPVGHRVEITEFADTRPEKKRYKRPSFEDACAYPALLDLDTGVRYMSHVHASRGGNSSYLPSPYPVAPLPGLPVSRVYRAVVRACALVMVDAVDNQYTTLVVEPAEE
ncbi:hypothetical protein [Streptomyces sp. NPDC050560]|uniref:hypothetical protein n=1 Tax=Streptomyces sp. NPDC050560 TaxID=3365630 RepID=UPI0037A882F9